MEENRIILRSDRIVPSLENTFTREQVFTALRRNHDCLNYMLGVHPTMIRDHATTYTAGDILQQLRRNDPVEVLEYMNRLHPTMFEDADLQPDCYIDLLEGYRDARNVRNFIETFNLLNIRIGVIIPVSFVGIMAHPYYNLTNDRICEVIQIVIDDNPSQITHLVPDNMESLVTVYEIVSGGRGRGRASRQSELINTYVLPAYIFAPIVRNHFLHNPNQYFNRSSPRDTHIPYLEFFQDIVMERPINLERLMSVLHAIPRELKHMTRCLIDFVVDEDYLHQRLTDYADDLDDISLGSGPDTTRPGMRLSLAARSSAARSSAPSSSAGFFSAPSSDAGFFSTPSSDAGYFLFN
jgi:hypothetical protein